MWFRFPVTVLAALFVILPALRASPAPDHQALRTAAEAARQWEKRYPSKASAQVADDALAALGRYEAPNDAAMKSLASPLSPVTATAETEPNNTVLEATALDLSLGYAVGTGSIAPAADHDFWSFTAPAGSRVWIETDTGGAQISDAPNRDTVIDLYAADGTTVIESDDDDGSGNGGDGTIETGLCSLIAGRTLVAGGTYYVRVRAYSGTAIINPYRLSLALTQVVAEPETESNDTAGTATPIASLISLHGAAIGAAADVDYYSFSAVAGDVVFFAADADVDRDGAGTDLVLEVRNSADVLLLSVDSSIAGAVLNPASEGANYQITADGTYYVRVRHFNASDTGVYDLMVAIGVNLAPPVDPVFMDSFE